MTKVDALTAARKALAYLAKVNSEMGHAKSDAEFDEWLEIHDGAQDCASAAIINLAHSDDHQAEVDGVTYEVWLTPSQDGRLHPYVRPAE